MDAREITIALMDVMSERFKAIEDVLSEVRVDAAQCREGVHDLKNYLVAIRTESEIIRETLLAQGLITKESSDACEEVWESVKRGVPQQR